MTDALLPRVRSEIAVGAVHVPDWLSVDQQRDIVAACRDWATGPVPMRAAVLPGGHQMSVRTVCLGWHWQPYRYTRTADDAGGGRVADFPDWMVDPRATGTGRCLPGPARRGRVHPRRSR